MYPRSFLYEEAKIEQRTPLKDVNRNPDSHPFNGCIVYSVSENI